MGEARAHADETPDPRATDAGLTGPPVCPACDYDLTGVAPSRCPECGARFSEADLDVYRSLPDARAAYIATNRRPTMWAYASLASLAPLIAWAHGAVTNRGFAWREMVMMAALLAFTAGGGSAVLQRSSASQRAAARAAWLRTSASAHAPWCVAAGSALVLLPREARGLVGIGLMFLAAALAPLCFGIWRRDWLDVVGPLEIAPVGWRAFALQAIATVSALAGAVLAVTMLARAFF